MPTRPSIFTRTTTFTQVPPLQERAQDDESRRTLEASVEAFGRAAEHLAGLSYRGALEESLLAVRHAYAAFLAWHSLPAPPEASLDELGRAAEHLDNVLRTFRRRAIPMEGLEARLGEAARTVAEREAVEEGFYTARDTLRAVLGALPPRITAEAAAAFGRVPDPRTGRIPGGPEALPEDAEAAPERLP